MEEPRSKTDKTEMNNEDVVKNLFTKKYTYKEKVNALADLELGSGLAQMIKKYQPDYYATGAFEGPLPFLLGQALEDFENGKLIMPPKLLGTDPLSFTPEEIEKLKEAVKKHRENTAK